MPLAGARRRAGVEDYVSHMGPVILEPRGYVLEKLGTGTGQSAVSVQSGHLCQNPDARVLAILAAVSRQLTELTLQRPRISLHET